MVMRMRLCVMLYIHGLSCLMFRGFSKVPHAYNIFWDKINYTCIFRIYRPNWMTFGTGDLHKLRLATVSFIKIGAGKAIPFLWGR